MFDETASDTAHKRMKIITRKWNNKLNEVRPVKILIFKYHYSRVSGEQKEDSPFNHRYITPYSDIATLGELEWKERFIANINRARTPNNDNTKPSKVAQFKVMWCTYFCISVV